MKKTHINHIYYKHVWLNSVYYSIINYTQGFLAGIGLRANTTHNQIALKLNGTVTKATGDNKH